MAETNPIYKNCPLFKSGPKKCCGAQHERDREIRRKFCITLKYINGQPSRSIPAFSLSSPIIEHEMWATTKFESSELQEALLTRAELTSESTETLRSIHSGYVITELDINCPFKR